MKGQPKAGKVEKYLLTRISQEGTIHMALLDPEKATPAEARSIAKQACEAGTAAIMVGGSTVGDAQTVDQVVKAVKEAVDVPVILFPNNVSGVSRYADAIWFMSLLNSTNPYFITGIQALAAPLVERYGLEVLPTAYLILGDGGAAGYMGQARPIPCDMPEIVIAYALAAKHLGMRFVYLEAGSGAKEPVPPAVVSPVKQATKLAVIVGGGIRSPDVAKGIAEAGADIIVTGTLVESIADIGRAIKEIVTAIRCR